ncbi:uncharacterized protein NFIA_031200 [Aspergillus fischeri NRRL 181]|uniref:Uncharacterized protein n=1 Tax=Neosartorya fischeri (strain ATCC 1020 / DSM 3700 / CBS 544.65 / FGSC A1164 / JCM 1740 / NRRL 181 / WB 181) TaxID=331117 RepID=A1DA55_NEOFI|nr:uncharacterized protein NFIA_031200 [Aspergillus fischeri NRRL 181]EAW20686.1 hypothetical protein NFIA_031200 [Aspergillus fischeri NRRL 181]
MNMGKVLGLGWVIIASWNDPEDMIRNEPKHVNNISFKLSKEGLRMIMTTYLYFPLFVDTIEHIDADNPRSVVAVVRALAVERAVVLWKAPFREEVVNQGFTNASVGTR